MDAPESLPPVFVIGTGRSGTTLLRRMLCAHPRIHLTHEASFWVWEAPFAQRRGAKAFVAHYVRTFSFRWLRLDPRPLLAALPDPLDWADLPAFYADIMRAQAARYGKVRFGDKTPSHSGNLDRLFRDFPDARVIRVVRDPRGVVDSLTWMPWASRSLLACSLLCEAERRQVAPYRDRILEIRLEDLLAHPRATMERVLAYIGEPFDARVLAHHLHAPEPDDTPPVPWFAAAALPLQPPEPTWDRWDPRALRLVEALNRGGLAEQGYAPAPLPTEPGRLAVLLYGLADLPELMRFLAVFLAMLWGARDPDLSDTPAARARFRRLNPRAWARYPGFDVPPPPPLPDDWRDAIDKPRG